MNPPYNAKPRVLNEVLSLNAQESDGLRVGHHNEWSSMKS